MVSAEPNRIRPLSSTRRATSLDLEAVNFLPTSIDTNAGETNKEKREQIRHLEKEAFQLANYYFLFQGVIFTAFYNTPSPLKCKYRWIPFTLSCLAGSLNLCTLSKIVLDYKSRLNDKDGYATRRTCDSRTPPSGGTESSDDEPIAVKCERHWRLFYACCAMFLFTAFFVITLVGCWITTCGDEKP